MSKKNNSRGLRSIGIRKVVPNQINFNQAISGSLALTQITTPSSVPDGLGQIYFKSDGKLYFKSDKFEETDLLAGSNGLSFLFTTAVLTIESDATYGDTDVDGGDWPANFSNGPSAKVDASVPGIPAFTTTGHDFTNTTNGGNPGENTYRIDASRSSATTDNGTDLTVALSGHNDISPTNFSIDLSNGSKSVLKLNVTLDSSSNTKITLNNLSQYENAANDQTFSSVVVNIPFKVNIAGTITTVTRTITVQKIRTGLEGTTSRTVNLTANRIVFEYNENNGEIGQLTSTVTATALNTTGQVYFQFLVDGVAHNDVNHGTGPIAGSVVNGNYTATITYDPPASFTNMPQVIECRIREQTGTDAGTILARDQIGMIGAKEGSGAYQVYMENSAHVVPATRGGNGGGDATTLDMTNSNPGFIAVFKGATRLTLVTSGTPTTGQFKVTSVTQSPASNAGGISTVDQSAAVQNDNTSPGFNKDAIFGDHGDMGTANTGIVTYTVNCENVQTLSVIQTVTKSIQGTRGETGPGGSNARAVEFTVTSNTPVIEFDDLGAVEAGVTHASVELTATTRNTTGTMTFVYEIDDVEITNSNIGHHTINGNVFTYSTTGKTYNDFPERIEVIAKENGSEVARDQITLIGIKPGSDAYQVSMPNDNTTVTSTEANDGAGDANIDYSSTSDTIRLFKGNVQLEPIFGGSGTTVIGTTNTPTAGQFSVISQTVTNGTVTKPTLTRDVNNANDKHIDVGVLSGLTDDLANITYVFNCEGLTQLSKTVTVAKSKQGVNGTPGETGLGVDLEIDPPVVVYNDLGTTPDVTSTTITATTRNLGTEIARSAFFNHTSARAARSDAAGGLGVSAQNNMAIAFWVRFPSSETFTANYNRYVCLSNELQIYLYQDDLYFKHKRVGSNILAGAVKGAFFSTSDAGKWMHIIIQRQYNGGMLIYKNGTIVVNGSHNATANTAVQALDSTFYLGNDSSGNNHLGAELSNFVIWNTNGGSTLASEQYNSGKVLTSPIANGITYASNVEVWYKLDEDQGTSSATSTSILDSSGNSKNLTATTQLESVSNTGLFSKSGPSYFTFKVGGTVIGSANQTLNYATYTVPSTFDSFKGDPKSVIVELKRDSADSSVEAIDQGVITAIKPGPGAPSVILSNPFHYFNGADGTGTVSSFTGTGTQIQVIKNGEYLTAIGHNGNLNPGQFKVSAVNTPSVGVAPPAVSTYTLSDQNSSGHNDTVTVGDMSEHGSNVFSKANGQTTEVLYTVNIEGTDSASTVIARQNFIVQTSGADGDPGLNAGLIVDINPPLAVVQTDRFGAPLTGTPPALDITETTITVRDTTLSSGQLLEAVANGSVTVGNMSNHSYKVLQNSTLTTTQTDNYIYSNSHTTPDITYRSGNNNTTKIEKLATMTTDSMIRVFDVTVKNSNGDDFIMQVAQQILKVVTDVETFGPVLQDPVKIFDRQLTEDHYYPVITNGSGFPVGSVSADVKFRRIINGTETLVDYQHPNNGTDNNKFWIDNFAGASFSGELDSTSPVDNNYTSQVQVIGGNTARCWAFLNGFQFVVFNTSLHCFIDIPVKYRDTTGTVHTFNERQTIQINTVRLPTHRVQTEYYYNFAVGAQSAVTNKWKQFHIPGAGSDESDIAVFPYFSTTPSWDPFYVRDAFGSFQRESAYDGSPLRQHVQYSTSQPAHWTTSATYSGGVITKFNNPFSGVSQANQKKSIWFTTHRQLRAHEGSGPEKSFGYIVFDSLGWHATANTSSERDVKMRIYLCYNTSNTSTGSDPKVAGVLHFADGVNNSDGNSIHDTDDAALKLNMVENGVRYRLDGISATHDTSDYANKGLGSTNTVVIPSSSHVYLVAYFFRSTATNNFISPYSAHDRVLPNTGTFEAHLSLNFSDITQVFYGSAVI